MTISYQIQKKKKSMYWQMNQDCLAVLCPYIYVFVFHPMQLIILFSSFTNSSLCVFSSFLSLAEKIVTAL